jgi:hypothetical protein
MSPDNPYYQHSFQEQKASGINTGAARLLAAKNQGIPATEDRTQVNSLISRILDRTGSLRNELGSSGTRARSNQLGAA